MTNRKYTNRRYLDALEKKVLVFDGAMGTRLYEKGVYINRVYDELNLSQPTLIQEVHREYLAGDEKHCNFTFSDREVPARPFAE